MELTIEQILQQAVVAHKEGNLRGAERLYRVIIQSQPVHPYANHNLGVLAVSVNKADLALPLLKTALEANPKIEQFWLSYIDALIKGSQFEAAKQTIEQAKKQGVSRENLNNLESRLASKTQGGNFHNASPSQEQLNGLLTHYQSGRYHDAERLALSITEQFPEHPFGWKVLGAALRAHGRLGDSLIASQKFVQITPQDAEALSNLGHILKDLNRLDEAEASYNKAIRLKSDYIEAHRNLGNTLKDRGRLEEAEASYHKAMVLKPDLAELHFHLGVTLHGLRRLEEAEANYNKAIALIPDLAEVHYNLGVTLQDLSRLDGAEASYNKAIALKPDFTHALIRRWQLLFDKKHFEAALRDADLIISEGVIELDLTTLYAMGQIDEIYKRIKIRSKTDSENISIAAFVAFFTELVKRDTDYNFCPSPMDYIYFSNLSSNIKNSAAYIAEIVEELDKVETVWEPNGTATHSGFQTPRERNLFKIPTEKIAQLKSIIVNEIDAYYVKFQNESCSYIKKWPSEKVIHGWHVVLKRQGYQSPHIHPGGWLSGVIYLKVVPSQGKNEGAIEFSLNGVNYSDVDSPKLIFQPESGDLVFFPSSLYHRTIPFTTDTDRVVISFDLMPEAI